MANRVVSRAWALALAAILVAGNGCAVSRYSYEPAFKPGALGQKAPLYAHLGPMEEGRTDMKPGMGFLGLVYIPLVPYASFEEQYTDAYYQELEAKWGMPSDIHDLELSSHAVYEELRRANLFDRVDFDPFFQDDYDVRLKARLTSTKAKKSLTFYGLTVAGSLFVLLGMPSVKVHQEVAYAITATDAGGEVLAQAQGAGKHSWVTNLWQADVSVRNPTQQLIAMRQASEQALPGLAEKLRAHFSEGGERLEKARQQRYAERLDPELVKFREALQGKEGPLAPAPKERLLAAYKEKREVLEALRLLERELSDKEQLAARRAWEERLDKHQRAAQARRNEAIAAAAQAAASAASQSGALGGGQSWNQMSDLQKGFAVAQQVSEVYNAIQDADAPQGTGQSPTQVALSEAMKGPRLAAFRTIQGDRREIRQQWMEKYHGDTGSFEEALRGPPAPLAPAAPQVELAEGEAGLAIESDPAGAEIFVNGAFFGMTPSALKFPAGTQLEIKLTKPGYADFVRQMILPPGNTLRIAAQMEAAGGQGVTGEAVPQQAAPAEAP